MTCAGAERDNMAVGITFNILRVAGIIFISPLRQREFTQALVVTIGITYIRSDLLTAVGLKISGKVYEVLGGFVMVCRTISILVSVVEQQGRFICSHSQLGGETQ